MIFDRDEFNRALFYPRRDFAEAPAGADDSFVEIEGVRLHVRSYAGDGPRLLLFHGNGEVVADYDDASEQFARAGVALAVADYRGYGASTGKPTLRAAIADARGIAEVVRPAIVMGRSLGGACAHELYVRPVDGMRAVIFESAFSDLDALVRRRGLQPPHAYAEEDLAVFEPMRKLRAGALPLLVLHGARDELIVPDEARAAYAAAASKHKRLVMVPGRGHNDVSFAPVYWEALADFVKGLG